MLLFNKLNNLKRNNMKHNIIKTENYLLVVDDSEIKYDDHFIDEYKMLYMLKNESTEKHKSVKKVISHLPLNNSPVLERVPLLPPLEDEQSLQQPKMPIVTGKQIGRAHV